MHTLYPYNFGDAWSTLAACVNLLKRLLAPEEWARVMPRQEYSASIALSIELVGISARNDMTEKSKSTRNEMKEWSQI